VAIAVLGAGSVGLVLGARLARAGDDVLFVTRRAEQAEQIAAQGVVLEDPAAGDVFEVRARARSLADATARELEAGPVLLCMRTPDVEAAARQLSAAAPGACMVGAQNGVDVDAILARRFARVLGLVVRLTCTRTSERSARALTGGRLVVGAHPQGPSEEAAALAARLRRAGFDVGVSDRLCEDRWLKLCVNLMSAPNALVRRADHRAPAFVEVKARLLEEARAVLAAAGIAARSCDGRDRSLDEEIAHQRSALARGASARDLPLYNQVWTALRGGGPLEADGYHRRILELAAAHGVPAPVNERVLAALLACRERGQGPESVAAAALLPD
jgi:2-dehydropantoate 2-reductase